MTELNVFLADTYALIEIVGGGLNYRPYLNHVLLTTKLNLIELYYHLLNDYGEDVADKYLQLYSKIVVPVSYSCIRYGMNFKLEHKKGKLSYTDCVGYALAFELGVKFLTGDEKFKDKENVEFVK